MQKRGAFIVIEGLDGSGKTTQAKFLASRLSQNHHALLTAEPSEGRIGAFIRYSCLYDAKRLHPETEALLFAADRIDHIENEIKPALKDGRLVISDRYFFSSFAYQGSAGLNLKWIRMLNEYALKPDLAIFIDVPPETVLKRLERRKSVMENLITQRRVREIYLAFVESGELVAVDGDKPESEVFASLLNVVLKFLEEFRGVTV